MLESCTKHKKDRADSRNCALLQLRTKKSDRTGLISFVATQPGGASYGGRRRETSATARQAQCADAKHQGHIQTPRGSLFVDAPCQIAKAAEQQAYSPLWCLVLQCEP
jgi:hypothetical protein